MSQLIDAKEVFPRLWVGSKPPAGYHLREAGFTRLVLCAVEYQMHARDFPGVVVIHCPFDDRKDQILTGAELALIFAAARAAAEAHRAGETVLSTCRMGINRSALVASLVMQMLGVPPGVSIDRIRAHRNVHCLGNPAFVRVALRENRQADFYLPRGA